ncbi:hypothetical protein ACFPM0_03970 [Pseudonocardia sulfidoxydans]
MWWTPSSTEAAALARERGWKPVEPAEPAGRVDHVCMRRKRWLMTFS